MLISCCGAGQGDVCETIQYIVGPKIIPSSFSDQHVFPIKSFFCHHPDLLEVTVISYPSLSRLSVLRESQQSGRLRARLTSFWGIFCHPGSITMWLAAPLPMESGVEDGGMSKRGGDVMSLAVVSLEVRPCHLPL